MDMTNLQSLSIFLTERLTLAAQEIFKAVEVTVTEYHDEISRSRQENELLRSRLLEAGIELYSELQPGVSALPDGLASAAEPWGEEGADIRVKLELSATRDEPAPPSPTPWREGEARVEDALGTLTADSGAGALLHAAPFAQDVKEEPEDAGTDLRTEASSAAANRACGLEDALESYRLTPVHKALRSKASPAAQHRAARTKKLWAMGPQEHPAAVRENSPCGFVVHPYAPCLGKTPDGRVCDPTESSPYGLVQLPLTSKSRVTLHKRCINYDPMGQDKELTQRRERESDYAVRTDRSAPGRIALGRIAWLLGKAAWVPRYRMKRARGKSKLLKVGRERKTEQSTEPTACRILGDSLADVTLLDEDQSPPSRKRPQNCVFTLADCERRVFNNCLLGYALGFQANLANLTEEMSENGQEPSAMFHGGPVEDDSLAGANLCVVCGRTFTSRGLLKIHLRVHSGEKPYHCHFCDKNFRQSSHLNVHVRIHTGEKPYSCPTCGKRFSDRSARNRHLKVHLESAEEIH
ncbi:hypothetical protein P4O66_006525, partial [Electrophorus voltai]